VRHSIARAERRHQSVYVVANRLEISDGRLWRLQSAAEVGDAVAVQSATEALLRAIKAAAKDIHDKYVNPPATTDYAIMFFGDRGTVRRGAARAAARRGDAAEVSGGNRGADYFIGYREQFAYGVSDARG
jgi:hypothetical protein